MKLVSTKVRESARGEQCTLRLPAICNWDTETTVLAHLPVGQKGMGMKTPDIFAVYACSSCHDALDRRIRAVVEHRDMLRALAETQCRLIEKGLIRVG